MPHETRHEHFVLVCENHQFTAYVNRDRTCMYKSMGKDEVYSFCVAVKFAINYRTTKVCMLQLPQNMKDKMMPLDVLLRGKLLPCEPFFLLTGSFVSIFIDNPLEKYIFSTQTD